MPAPGTRTGRSLLSIGYSACHWCHVMERESFDDPETARLLNEGFVSVKVDRRSAPTWTQSTCGPSRRSPEEAAGRSPCSHSRGGALLRRDLLSARAPTRNALIPSAARGTQQAWEDRREDVLSAAEQIRGCSSGLTWVPHGGEDADGVELEPALLESVVRRYSVTSIRYTGALGERQSSLSPWSWASSSNSMR